MDKLWAVAVYNNFEGTILLEFVRSNSWHGAMAQHTALKDFTDAIDFTTMETAKQSVFNQDSSVEVVEVPGE
ncbi:MAG: hypothetical protein LAO23_19555 [Acidobacteriia bacterium]|nr:hypothetical protein [Terriglobia bacterium]